MQIRRFSGFTLIELLVVVAIIAVLMAILMPALGNAKRISMQTKCGTNLKGVGSAIFSFSTDFGRLPTAGWQSLSGITFDGQAIWFRHKYPNTSTPPTYNNEDDGLNGGTWLGTAHNLGRYLGGSKSNLFYCPAPTTPTNAFAFVWGMVEDPNSLSDPKQRLQIGFAGNRPYVLSNYQFFMGVDSSVTTANTGNVGLLGKFKTADSSGAQTAVNFTDAVTNLRLPSLTPTMVLAQDVLELNTNLGSIYRGNHISSAGGAPFDTLSAQISTLTTAAAVAGANSNFEQPMFQGPAITNFAGANVLRADGSVTFTRPSDLTQTWCINNAADPRRFYLGYSAN